MTRTSWTPKPLIQTPPPDYVEGAWYDGDAVDRVVRFFRNLKQVKGRWRGTSFELIDWQVEYLIAPVFGWKHADGNRIVRTAWWELNRKNGKSTISSGIGCYLFAADREKGGEVYAAAGKKDQARIVFDPAKEMATSWPTLKKRIKPYRSHMYYPATGSVFRVLASDAKLEHGLNVSGAVIDEVHVHKNRDLIDALETGTGSREQPLIVFITTADEGDEHSIYAEKRDYIEKVAKGIIRDPSTYGVIFAADEKAKNFDPFSEKALKQANPGYGVTVSPQYLKTQAAKAQNIPGYLNTYKRLHLGIRTKQEEGWIHLSDWDKSRGMVIEPDLAGMQAYGGIDLSSTRDLSAFQLVVPVGEDFKVLSHFWMPEEGLEERSKRESVPYDQWVKDGFITATEGNIIDYRKIRESIEKLAERFEIMDIAYDPWKATELVLELQDGGLEMTPMRQGFQTMSAPTKTLERLILSKKLHHGGNPVLRWMADCMSVKYDDNDNVRPVKPDRRKSSKRIDGIVATIMAVDRAMREEGQDTMPAVY